MKFNPGFKRIIFLSGLLVATVLQPVKADPLGAILGGIAGAQFGQGNGKIAMAIAGAVAGDVLTNSARNYNTTATSSSYSVAYPTTTEYAGYYPAAPVYYPTTPVYQRAHYYADRPAPRVYYTPSPRIVYAPAPVYSPYYSPRWEQERHEGYHRYYENRGYYERDNDRRGHERGWR